MTPALVDTHCHLQLERFDADREAVLSNALEALAWVVVVGDDLESSRAAIEMCGERVYATVGVHPHHAAHVTDETIETLATLAQRPDVVAVGEIGLDYHYDFSPRPDQRAAFERQLGLAARLERPVVIHCREADEDLAAVVEPMLGGLHGGIMHCFGGDAAFAERCLGWGFHISFAGNVTFPKAETLRDAARVVPMDRLLVETDSPYLAPQPVRGKRCEPVHVAHTAAFLADLKNVSLDEFAQRTSENAGHVFSVNI
ncbi:MAG: YchF/TatD family DNA exonuclease [Nitrospiraceae bacterium]|nr:YchF/TatD family DNA exonuclease [Nitrospiraceae bacterium]